MRLFGSHFARKNTAGTSCITSIHELVVCRPPITLMRLMARSLPWQHEWHESHHRPILRPGQQHRHPSANGEWPQTHNQWTSGKTSAHNTHVRSSRRVDHADGRRSKSFWRPRHHRSCPCAVQAGKPQPTATIVRWLRPCKKPQAELNDEATYEVYTAAVLDVAWISGNAAAHAHTAI